MKDLTIIKNCSLLLDESSSKTLRANMKFLYDKYVLHLDERARTERRSFRAKLEMRKKKKRKPKGP